MRSFTHIYEGNELSSEFRVQNSEFFELFVYLFIFFEIFFFGSFEQVIFCRSRYSIYIVVEFCLSFFFEFIDKIDFKFFTKHLDNLFCLFVIELYLVK